MSDAPDAERAAHARTLPLLFAAVMMPLLPGVALPRFSDGIPPSAEEERAKHEVVIDDFAFAPARLRVAVGDTIVWTNDDAVLHNARSSSGVIESGDIPAGDSRSVVARAKGEFRYVCTYHPNMTAALVIR